MANAAGIISKINAALKKTNPTEFLIYKRTIVRSGGDPLIGRPGSVDTTDVLLDPQPIYTRFGRDADGVRQPGASDTQAAGGGSALVSNDYEVLVSPNSITTAELTSDNSVFVFKDSESNEEVFRITDYVTQAYQGVVVTITVYLKSTGKKAAA